MQKGYLPQGSEVSSAGVHYRLWAPRAEKVELAVYDTAGVIKRRVPLLRGPNGYHHGLDEAGRPEDLYKFCIGDAAYPDPASRFQPQGVHGPSMVVDPAGFAWNDAGWKAPAVRDLVIYELHVGTFTPEGTYLVAIEKLRHLRDLGVTAIELMPLGDFPGERNWGYDGVYLYAPSRAYGDPDDLRTLVDAAHQLGLAVMLDVVYNHFGPDGNYLARYIGPYLDESAKTPWGGAIRYGDAEFQPLREFVIANPVYWMREFHIDGFRLDATHAIVDGSPRHILQEITAAIHEFGGFVIAEDPRNEQRLLEPESAGGIGFDAVWADDFHHSVRVGMTREHEGYLGDFQGSMGETIDTLAHGWHYRGQKSANPGEARGTACRHLPPERFVHCLSNHDQVGNHAFGQRVSALIGPEQYRAASALLCLSPYTPMLFMGQEWGATTPFLFFTDHHEELGKLITAGRREEFKAFAAFQDPALRARIPDPQSVGTFAASKLQWEEATAPVGVSLLTLYRAVLALRHGHSAFRPAGRDSWQAEVLCGEIGSLRLADEEGAWLVLLDLSGGHGTSLTDWRPGLSWHLVLSTNELRFGGDGRTAFTEGSTTVHFSTPELIVLRAQPASENSNS